MKAFAKEILQNIPFLPTQDSRRLREKLWSKISPQSTEIISVPDLISFFTKGLEEFDPKVVEKVVLRATKGVNHFQGTSITDRNTYIPREQFRLFLFKLHQQIVYLNFFVEMNNNSTDPMPKQELVSNIKILREWLDLPNMRPVSFSDLKELISIEDFVEWVQNVKGTEFEKEFFVKVNTMVGLTDFASHRIPNTAPVQKPKVANAN